MNNPLPWGRWYADHLDNPDYLLLNDTARVVFNELFCLCLKDGGTGSIRLSTIPLRLRRHPNQIKVAILALTGVGWVEDLGGDLLGLPGWSCRQRRGDHSGGSRVAKYRENKQLREACNVTRNGSVTPSETEGEAEGETEGATPEQMQAAPLAPILSGADAPLLTTTSAPPAKSARPWSKTMTREKAVEVFDYWRMKFKRNDRWLFNGKREKAIRARANDGVTFIEAKLAVLGLYYVAEHDTIGDKKRIEIPAMTEFELAFRDDSNLRRFIQLAQPMLDDNHFKVSDDGKMLIDRNGNPVKGWVS